MTVPAWAPAFVGWLAHSAWPRIWGAIIGSAVGQVVAYVKLRARIEAHHVAQMARSRSQHAEAQAGAAEAAGLQERHLTRLSDEVGALADATRAVLAGRQARAVQPENATLVDASAPNTDMASPVPST